MLPLSWEHPADRGRKVMVTQAGGSPSARGLDIVGRARESIFIAEVVRRHVACEDPVNNGQGSQV